MVRLSHDKPVFLLDSWLSPAASRGASTATSNFAVVPADHSGALPFPSGLSPTGFWSHAARHPEKVVVIEGDRLWTAGELHGLCNRIVHRLRKFGLGPGAMVAASMGNRGELLALLLAALQAGWHFLPLNPEAPPLEMEGALEASRPDLWIPDKNCRGASRAVSRLGKGRCYALSRLMSGLTEESDEPPGSRLSGSLVALTSGTTGQSRVVKRALSGLSPEHLGRRAAQHLGTVCGIAPSSGLVHLVASPLYHSASLLWCCDHLQLGHAVVLSRRWSAEEALRLIQAHRVTGTLMVPTHFRRLLDLPEEQRRAYDLSSLRHVVHTGAPCPVALKREMLEWLGPVITEVYGAAEGAGTRVGPDEWLRHPGTVGRGHGRVRVLRKGGEPCAPGEVGEVHLKLGGFSSVGDLGYLDEEDYLFLVGRQDDVILSGGVNLHPTELEEVLLLHPGVCDAAVIGVLDRDLGQRAHALIVPRAEGLSVGDLERHCRERLAPYKCPRAFEMVAALPRDEQGKLRRRQLRARGALQ